MIRRVSPVTLLAVALLTLASACTSGGSGSKPVVVVGEHKLSAKDFADQLASRIRGYDALSVKDPRTLNSSKQAILREFISQALIEDWAKQNKLILKKEAVDEEILRIRKMYPDEASFLQTLAQEQLDFDSWKTALSNTLLQRLVSKTISATSAPPTEAEIAENYRQNKETFKRPEQAHLRQILLATEADAQRIDEELRQGGKFENLAREFSISPEGKRKEGDLGWVSKGESEVFDAIFKFRVGQRSEIKRSPFGYHIVQLLGVRPAKSLTLDEVREVIAKRIMSNREQALYAAWLEEQLRTAQVLYDKELIDAINVETKGVR